MLLQGLPSTGAREELHGHASASLVPEDNRGFDIKTLQKNLRETYGDLFQQKFSHEAIQRVLRALPLQQISTEMALDWLLLQCDAHELPAQYAEQIRPKGAAEVLHAAAASTSKSRFEGSLDALEATDDEPQTVLGNLTEERDTRANGAPTLPAEKQQEEKEPEDNAATQKSWILRYAEEALSSSEEDEREEAEEDAGTAIEDWEIWGDPREVERRKMERSREMLPREARLKLIAEELSTVKEAATKAKMSSDKSAQKAAGQIIGQLKRELAALGASEEDLPSVCDAENGTESFGMNRREEPVAETQMTPCETTTMGAEDEGSRSDTNGADGNDASDADDDEDDGGAEAAINGQKIDEDDHACAFFPSESASDQRSKESKSENDDEDSVQTYDLFGDEAIQLEDDPGNEERRRRKAAQLLREARMKMDFTSDSDHGRKSRKPSRNVGGSKQTVQRVAPKAALQQICVQRGYGAPKYKKFGRMEPGGRLEHGYRYRVSVDVPSERKRGRSLQTTTKSFAVPEKEDGWESIEAAQNAAATVALLGLDTSNKNVCSILVSPFDELFVYLQAEGCGAAEETTETSEDLETKEIFIERLIEEKAREEALAGIDQGASTQLHDEEHEPSWSETLTQRLEEWERTASLSRSTQRSIGERLLKALHDWRDSKKGKAWARTRDELPITQLKRALHESLSQHDIVVISGETGSGKTTQIPQYILENEIEAMRGGECSILCTQPRRIAAITVAERVAIERGDPPPGERGSLIGYSVRLDTKTTPATRLLFCTTGVLLRRLTGDPALAAVSHVVVDEVHERTLQGDFLIALLRDLSIVRRRAGKPLKVVLMSATLDTQLLADYFGHCPVLSASGRTFPVQHLFLEDVYEETGYVVGPDAPVARRSTGHRRSRVEKIAVGARDRSIVRAGWGDDVDDTEILNPEYDSSLYEEYSSFARRNLARLDENRIDFDLMEDLLGHVHTAKDAGAILVFMPGMGEIVELMRRLESNKMFSDSWLIPLHSSISPGEQRKAFRKPPEGIRKIVIATNIAETSLTIDDVVYVVDSGKLKEKRHDPARGMSLLVEDWVSKANAEQRRGRAGRVQEGICYSLFTRKRFEQKMKAFQTPEIQRVPLEELVLQVRLLGVAPRSTEFLSRTLQPPPQTACDGALRVLREIGALYSDEKSESLTPLGYHLAQLPVDVRLGKLLLLASCLGCLSPALSIAACLAHKSPFAASTKQESDVLSRQRHFFAPASGTIAAGQQSDHLVMAAAIQGWLDARSGASSQETKHSQQSSKPSTAISSRKYARKYGLNEQILETIEEMRGQFAEMLADIGFLPKRSKVGNSQDGKQGRKGSHVMTDQRHWYDNSNLPANRYAQHPAVLKAVLLAALWPHLAVLSDTTSTSANASREPSLRSRQRQSTQKVWHDGSGRVVLHPSSICSSLDTKAFHRPFVTYLEKMKTSQVFLRDCTVVSPAAILLFGGSLKVDHTAGKVTVDGWVQVRATGKTAALVRGLRQGLHALLQRKISNPQEEFARSNGSKVIEAIVKLLNWEDAVAGWDI